MVATLLAFVSGYAAIAGLLRFLVNHSTLVFVVYRVVLGVVVLVLTATRRDLLDSLVVPLWGKFGIIALVALALTPAPGRARDGQRGPHRAVDRLLRADRPAWARGCSARTGPRSSPWSRASGSCCTRSVGLALLTFTATNRLFDQGGLGVLAWLALLGLATYGIYWVWTQYRRYAI